MAGSQQGWRVAKGGGGGSGSVQSVTGLNTDNTNPANPIVKISVNASTIQGDGTPANPLNVIATGLQGVQGTTGIQGTTGTSASINPTDKYIPVRTGATTFGDSYWVNDYVNLILKTQETTDRGIYMDFTTSFEDFRLTDNTGVTSVDWIVRVLRDVNADGSLDWGKRSMKTATTVYVQGSFIWSAEQGTNNNLAKTTTNDLYQNDFYVREEARKSILNYFATEDSDYSWWSGHTFEYASHGLDIGSIASFSGGTWSLLDVGSSSVSAEKLLGVVVSANAILLDGHCVLTTSPMDFPNVVACPDMTDGNLGTAIYGAQGVTGGTSIAPPSATGSYVRILGHCYESFNGEAPLLYLFFFRPQNSWIIV